MNKKIFCCLSPIILTIICFIFAIIFKDLLSIWVYMPCFLVLYWCLSLLFIHIGINISNIKGFFQKPSGSIGWLFLAIIIGFIPIVSFINYFHLLNSPFIITIVILLAIINPFFEEIFWRGFVLKFTFSSKKISFIYSVVLFTVNHIALAMTSLAVRSIYTFLSIIIMAIVWSVIRTKTKSIWWCILSHSLVNLFSLSALGLLNIYP